LSEWPINEKENLILGNISSNVGIITLWTRSKLIADKIPSNLYCAIGQLYFNGGINFILRNCLYNKNIRYLIVTGQDLAKAGDTLLALKNNGVDENNHIIGVHNSKIHKEIPKEAIDKFRQNVEILDFRGKTIEEIIDKINQLEKKESYGDSEIFPDNKIEPPEKLPSDSAVVKIKEKTIGRAWLEILYNISRFGATKPTSYGGFQKELINVLSVITDEDPFEPKWEEYFQFSKEELEEYIPQVTKNIKIENIHYTYGQRLREVQLKDGNKIDQINNIIDILSKEPYNRRAIAFTWNYESDPTSKEPPCINLVHVLVQENTLYLTVYIRSNDMYEAWPRNAFALRRLQGEIAREIGKSVPLKIGPLTTISGSAHIYDKNWTDTKEILDRNREWVLMRSTPLGNLINFRIDPKGNFLIKVEEGKIKAIHTDLDGNAIGNYEGKVAGELIVQISNNNLISEISHALDLGSELQKAEIALRTGKQYTQDKQLVL